MAGSTKYGAVSDDVRERVLAAAEELNRRPNELARNMNTGELNTIGVVVGDIENPRFGLVTKGITDTAKKSGYNDTWHLLVKRGSVGARPGVAFPADAG